MSNPSRIYKPGEVTEFKSQPEHQTSPSVPNQNGAQHPTTDADVPTIDAFPIAALPPVASTMASAIALTERTPEALAGCCILGIVSASIGAGLQIRSAPNRWTRGNLYIAVSAESGSGKSETFRHAAQPFLDMARQRVESWRTETQPLAEADKDMVEARIAELKKIAGKRMDPPQLTEIGVELRKLRKELIELEVACQAPAMFCDDVTTERLAVLMLQNGEQIASLSADAGTIVNNLLGRYCKLKRTDESIYLKAFSGDECRGDRQGRGPVMLKRPCLSALWLTQPDKIETLMAEQSLMDGGLIPRLLLCHTHARAQPIGEGSIGIPPNALSDWTKLVQELVETFRNRREPITVEPSPEAFQALNAHYNEIVKRRDAELSDVGIFAARWNEQAWRIAVSLHAALHGGHAGEMQLKLETAKRAITLADWFARQQLQILSGRRAAARGKKRDEVLGLLVDKPQGITARDVQRARIVIDADGARALLAELESQHHLVGHDSKPESGGHRIRSYTKA